MSKSLLITRILNENFVYGATSTPYVMQEDMLPDDANDFAAIPSVDIDYLTGTIASDVSAEIIAPEFLVIPPKGLSEELVISGIFEICARIGLTSGQATKTVDLDKIVTTISQVDKVTGALTAIKTITVLYTGKTNTLITERILSAIHEDSFDAPVRISLTDTLLSVGMSIWAHKETGALDGSLRLYMERGSADTYLSASIW